MELLPCPFCGSKDIKLHQQHWHMTRKAQCYMCHSESTYDEEQDIKTWNTRHSPWISVKDKLPEKDGRYLVIINKYHPYNNKEITDTFMEVDLFVNNLFHKELPGSSLYGRNYVTHWMPLPKLPEEK